MSTTKQYLLDKLVPGLIATLLYTSIQLYIDVQVMKKEFKLLETSYYDILEQINNQLEKR